jgi:hypothetical protein
MANDDEPRSLFSELDKAAAEHIAMRELKKKKEEHARKEAERAEKRKTNPLL